MTAAQPTKVHAHVRTDIGMVREHNEDNAWVDPAGTYFVVADGMGGHAAGEVASAMAVEEVKRALEAARPQIEAFAHAPGDEGRQALVQVLEDAVRRAHQAVYERGGRESDKRGMGTTLDVLLVADGEAFVAHVGDSRTYLLRNGAAAQVTTDHTVAEVLVIEGKLSPEEARLSPLRTILVNAIGVSADVGVELAHLKLRRGDKLLLCSDGLHDYFPTDSELGELLAETGGEAGLLRLVDLAKERGGHDNITGVLIEVIEGNPTVAEEDAGLRATRGRAQTEEMKVPEVPTVPEVPVVAEREAERVAEKADAKPAEGAAEADKADEAAAAGTADKADTADKAADDKPSAADTKPAAAAEAKAPD